MPARWRTAVWGTAALLLLAPLVAMQFTGEVKWHVGDFVAAAMMLALACGSYELAARTRDDRAYRAAAGIAIAAALLLVWMNLAVGIIGDEENPANLMFGGVLAIGGIGTVIARLRPRGMARALVATAVAQAVVAVVSLAMGFGAVEPDRPWDVVVLTGLFAALWLASAWLFRKAAANKSPAGAAA